MTSNKYVFHCDLIRILPVHSSNLQFDTDTSGSLYHDIVKQKLLLQSVWMRDYINMMFVFPRQSLTLLCIAVDLFSKVNLFKEQTVVAKTQPGRKRFCNDFTSLDAADLNVLALLIMSPLQHKWQIHFFLSDLCIQNCIDIQYLYSGNKDVLKWYPWSKYLMLSRDYGHLSQTHDYKYVQNKLTEECMRHLKGPKYEI